MTEHDEVPDDGSAGEYVECYVAFLDVLGFTELVSRSKDCRETRDKLVKLAGAFARLDSGTKDTTGGPCPVQVRSFSDSFVIFTPREGDQTIQPHDNPLPQLLFVVRFLHDRIADLGSCVRGGVALGGMYWRTEWSETDPLHNEPPIPAVTLGPGLIAAVNLERESAKYPRIAVAGSVVEQARCVSSRPFSVGNGRLDRRVRVDDDGVAYLDILGADVTRSRREKHLPTAHGFTIKYYRENDARLDVLDALRRVQIEGLESADPRVRRKHEWLRNYLDRSEAPRDRTPVGRG